MYTQILEEANAKVINKKNKELFFDYVTKKEAERANKIFMAITCVEDFAIKNKVINQSLYDNLSEQLIDNLLKRVIKNKFFAIKYKKIFFYAELGLKLLRIYILENNTMTSTISTTEKAGEELNTIENISEQSLSIEEQNLLLSSKLLNNCNIILRESFDDGYRLGNYMHQMRFISCYEECYEKQLDKEGEELDELLKNIGRVIEDRVFASNSENCSHLLTELYSDIQNAFDNGASAIYFECLFEKYNRRLISEMNIYDEDTLRLVLQEDSKLPVGYSVGKLYITMYGRSKDINAEIKDVLKNSHVPLTYNDIHSIIWYIPINKIKVALNQITEAVHVDEASYFYAPNFNISTEELAQLINAMHNTIYSKGFLVANDLRKLFREKCPSSAMDTENYKDYAIREILKVFLKDKFSFSSSVVTEIGASLDIGSVYENYASEHDKLTIAELKEFENELGINIYWYNVMKQMIRINENELVNKKLIQFDVTAIDNVLELLCPGDYVALKDVKLFLSFPAFSYKWNGFVLESYLRDYSQKFRLIQLSISSTSFVGVMVKNSSKYQLYDDIAADTLAKSTEWKDEKTALKCLVNAGFQQRATNKNISSIIKMAKQIREIKE